MINLYQLAEAINMIVIAKTPEEANAAPDMLGKIFSFHQSGDFTKYDFHAEHQRFAMTNVVIANSEFRDCNIEDVSYSFIRGSYFEDCRFNDNVFVIEATCSSFRNCIFENSTVIMRMNDCTITDCKFINCDVTVIDDGQVIIDKDVLFLNTTTTYVYPEKGKKNQ